MVMSSEQCCQGYTGRKEVAALTVPHSQCTLQGTKRTKKKSHLAPPYIHTVGSRQKAAEQRWEEIQVWKLLSLQSPPSLSPNLLCLLKEVMGTLGMAVRLAGTWKLLTSVQAG